uniref:Uncharacterized protein n=1 Tax=Cercocebus atys TaxID=9531 RepID=A0A2K5LSV4_CERAT
MSRIGRLIAQVLHGQLLLCILSLAKDQGQSSFWARLNSCLPSYHRCFWHHCPGGAPGTVVGSQASTLLCDEELEEIEKETGLSHRQITRLCRRFNDFQGIPELAINPVGNWIINAFFPEGEDQVNFRGFLQTLAHFRTIEDNEKSKDVNGPEPLNSRSAMHDGPSTYLR